MDDVAGQRVVGRSRVKLVKSLVYVRFLAVRRDNLDRVRWGPSIAVSSPYAELAVNASASAVNMVVMSLTGLRGVLSLIPLLPSSECSQSQSGGERGPRPSSDIPTFDYKRQRLMLRQEKMRIKQ